MDRNTPADSMDSDLKRATDKSTIKQFRMEVQTEAKTSNEEETIFIKKVGSKKEPRTTSIHGMFPMEDAPQNLFLWENIRISSFFPPQEKKGKLVPGQQVDLEHLRHFQ